MDNLIQYNEEHDRIESQNFQYTLSLNIDSFIDDKERKQYVRSIKQLITRFPEYKRWREYIIESLGFNRCFFTHESVDELSLEVHHHPICREAIVNCVIDKKIENEEEFNSLDILKEVMDLHFRNKVGYVVLIRSLHEKFHNGYLQIPMNFVQGDWKFIMDNYTISPQYGETIQHYINYYDNEYRYAWIKNNETDNINRDIV